MVPLLSMAAGAEHLAALVERFLFGRCLVITLANRRPLAVTALGVEPVTTDPLRLGLLLAGGRASHEFAAEHGRLTLNLLPSGAAHLARRYGRIGLGAGWDEVLGVQLRYRGALVPSLAQATAFLDVIAELPRPSGDWLLARVLGGEGPSGAPPPYHR